MFIIDETELEEQAMLDEMEDWFLLHDWDLEETN